MRGEAFRPLNRETTELQMRAEDAKPDRTITAASPLNTLPLSVPKKPFSHQGVIVSPNPNRQNNCARKLRIEIFPSGKLSGRFNYFTGGCVQKMTGRESDCETERARIIITIPKNVSSRSYFNWPRIGNGRSLGTYTPGSLKASLNLFKRWRQEWTTMIRI
ncbi:MAG: hypothetical protein DMG70_18615 [Acidobacteria bacterium]|nr:MAG: hypothetical protein DMG70_18615 [Acidobacteriota bacterium]PYY06876.1 MAG: hypothetical protein DMG69_21980 [Acidobacteriota bacterium]